MAVRGTISRFSEGSPIIYAAINRHVGQTNHRGLRGARASDFARDNGKPERGCLTPSYTATSVFFGPSGLSLFFPWALMEGNNPSAVSTPPTSNIPLIVHQPTMADKILNEEHVARAVVFPEEEKIGIMTRVKGVEMKRTLTQEDKELAAAGYDHLHTKDDKTEKTTSVDITEHQLDFDGLVDELKTNISTKDAGQSHGLTSDEAKARLQRDGANVLTPPRKKSALRKVCYVCC